ncbi:MAG: SDR family oxidoreductase [Candidatus Nanopelagicales bacterium]
MVTALVTGPTSGLGRQFAIQLAAAGVDLILVARDETRLVELDLELSTSYGITCEVIPTDLSNRAALKAIENRVADVSRPVDWVVNNAGFGLAEPFLNTDVEDEQRLLDVLVTAPLRLTHAALPGMVERGFGRVIVVSSFASWVTSGTYSAAKAWATVFVEGLAAELADTGVHATALCPGFVRTEFHDRADMDVAKIPKQLWLDPADVVAKAIKDCEKGNVLSVPGKQYQAMAPMVRLSPRALVRRVTALGTVDPNTP